MIPNSGPFPLSQDIVIFTLSETLKGTFTTHSEGSLTVPFSLPGKTGEWFFGHPHPPNDIHALRSYLIRALKPGTRGSSEFHRFRKEIVSVLEGKVRFYFEDAYGNQRVETLEKHQSLLLPPLIWHTYEVLATAELLVLANTNYTPGASAEENDTFYDRTIFDKFQSTLKQ